MGKNVLLWGEDEFLLREAAAEAFGSLWEHVREVEGDAWTGGETGDLATPSLFGEPRALLVSGCQDLSDEGAREVRAYLEHPAPDATLVLTGRGIRAAPPLAKGLPAGIEVRRVEITRRDLPGWVKRRGERRGVRAEPAALAALIDTVGEDPGRLDQALEQLVNAFPDQPITSRHVEEQFRGLGDRKTWEVTDRAFGGDLAGAIRALAGMLAARDDPLMILGGIAARLRDLQRVAALPDGIHPRDLAREAGMRFDWQARRAREQARRYEPGDLAALHRTVAEMDRAIKIGVPGEVILPLLLARISRAVPPREPYTAPRMGG
ncbi:MAG TPA: DNA polymerase III subunit delta [Actinomycetota bacterium]|nr:DNA polymerase III subunit delta [Actinomycetota bacterium]